MGLFVKRVLTLVGSWLRRWRVFLGVVVGVVVFDQVTKFLAVAGLTHAFGEASDSFPLATKVSVFLFGKHPSSAQAVVFVENFWRWSYVENTGAAFSFLASVGAAWFRTPFLLLVSLVAMVFIVVYYRRLDGRVSLMRLALMLVFGGALGNFLDRVRLGYVIDFIVWHWYDKAQWPTFNVADAAISVGVGLMVLDMLLSPKSKAAHAEHAR